AKEVVTIEGLAAMPGSRGAAGPTFEAEALHPLQKAFVDLGAAQCGYCIPGIIMEAQALISSNPNPTRQDIVSRLSRNLCRCTGYTKVIDAVLLAAEVMRDGVGDRSAPAIRGRIGEAVPKFDSEAHVTGRSLYAADLKLDNALQVKILRSPHHHARILAIDTSLAESLPGVVAVLTARDVPGTAEMLNARPQVHIFAKDRVRFMGEAVAAVAALSDAIALEALALITIEYEALTPVFDPVEAMSNSAEQIHPPFPNWIRVATVTCGDADRALSESDVVIEGTYSTSTREHAPMEPEAGIAFLDDENRLTIHAPHHHPFAAQRWIASLLAIPLERVRIVCPAMGGNFGHRGDFLHSGVLGMVVLKTGRPARIVFTREESLVGSGKAMSYVLRYKTGANSDGRLTALKAEIIGNGGCWIPHPEVTKKISNISKIGQFSPGPYVVPNAHVDIFETSTNRPRSNPMRGTNTPDLAFAWESQMDMLAAKLDIDPLEFRLRNIIETGFTTISGVLLDESVGARATLEALRAPYAKARARIESEPPVAPFRRGIGLACIAHQVGAGRGEEGGGGWHGLKLGPAKAGVELLDDGRIRVQSGVVEKGQGITIALAQIAAQELDVNLDSLVMVYGDTLLAPYPIATSGQRTLFHAGGAVQRACQELKRGLAAAAATELNRPIDDFSFQDGWVVTDGDERKKLSFASLAKLMREGGLPRHFEGTFTFEKSEKYQGPVYGYASQLSELDVNTDTGEVKVRYVTYAADVGTVINRQSMEGQVDGGVLMGLSYALKEAFVSGETGSLKEYGLPTIKDAPDAVTRILLEDHPVVGGPFGAKGAAEMTCSAGIASVANAIANAVGARVYDIPARPAVVLNALRELEPARRHR
ncbi:MAG TPA: molybdopterin cofactor-binding domain-containing protein, partial [Acidimicrobiales bacterium]|nr:molybdopterin cofactor-binding domain-containing protein [Acidimicrobiales bacterium]